MSNENGSSMTATEGKSKVVDYLDTPKIKRKEHILVALSDQFDSDMRVSMIRFLTEKFKGVVISTPATFPEFLKTLNKKILYCLIDDEFAEWQKLSTALKKLKENNHETGLPVIFLTRNCGQLIDSYHNTLNAYQEQDDYIEYKRINPRFLRSSLDKVLTTGLKRRSRRYRVHLPVSYTSLSRSGRCPGELIDLSVHGALLHDAEQRTFRQNEQIQVFLNISNVLKDRDGEFVTFSALVRRVNIGGTIAGISWEYLTDKKYGEIFEIVAHHSKKYTDMKLQAFLSAQRKAANKR